MRTSVRVSSALAALVSFTLVGCAGSEPPPAAPTPTPPATSTPKAPPKAPPAPAAGGVSYGIGFELDIQPLYPSSSWLPAPYNQSYPQYEMTTIKKFVEQSLQRDGIAYSSVTVQMMEAHWFVMIASNDPRVQGYATVHPALFDANHAQQALNGVNLCKATQGCWDPKPVSGQPWAFFLPIGMAMVNQQSVMFLDYPPDASLIAGDYLNNFTMQRWSRVLTYSGVAAANVTQWETIVDARPIAAKGSGQTGALPDSYTYFNTPGSNHYYTTPMLQLLIDPPSNTSPNTTRPLGVFGSPAIAAWSKIVGSTVKVGDVGSITFPGSSKVTPWIADNHPDVTTYQCCANDPAQACQDPGYGPSWSLVADEQLDFQVSCWQQVMASNSGQSPQQALTYCQSLWGGSSTPAANAQALCINAKLDDQDPNSRCPTAAAAQAYCASTNNNPCPPNVYSCIPQGAPPPADKKTDKKGASKPDKKPEAKPAKK